MSKPRSRYVSKPDHEFATVRGFSTVIHFGKQAKHVSGHPNHDPSKSTITIGMGRLQTLVEQKAGTGHWYQSNREVVDFGETIGVYREPHTGREISTARGTLHYSKSGVHVVPADPHPKKGSLA